ncbi:MAG: ISKra4 family transposase, partial [Geminicoccaceae bacterium]
RCRPTNSKTFSPLNELFAGHTAPELLYLEAKWASLVSYGMTVDLLKDVLPIGAKTNAETVRRHLHQVATRAEAELGQEQISFIDGCPAMWRDLPQPEGPMVVGIDGGYVRNWNDKKKNFEVVVGKSIPEKRDDRYFGLVQSHDAKPKRRLFEVLRDQGLQMNQEITFLTDGGDSVRNLAELMSPCAEHILDWFHIAMRLTVLGQYAKGLKHHDLKEAEEAETYLEKIKWYLWHGNVREALCRAEWLTDDLSFLESSYPSMKRFATTAEEFQTYITNNAHTIPNYGERWRYGERVSTSFVESTVNVVVGKRFAKKQQMQWSKKGAHLLLQTRTRTLDGTLRKMFTKWHPGMAANTQETSICAKAA